MIRKLKGILLCLPLAFFLFGAIGCEQEGTMEKSGKAVDKAVKEAGNALKDAKDKTEDAIDDAKK